MNKQYFIWGAFLALLLIVVSCSEQPSSPQVTQENNTQSIMSVISEPCGAAEEYTLYAGQTIDAGTVTIANDAENLCVTFNTTAGDWIIVETHLHLAATVDGIPQKNGNPIPGQFDHKREYDFAEGVQIDEYCFNIGDLNFDENECLVVAAHASLTKIIGYDNEGNPIYQQETGWADGEDFPGKNWATYFNYCLQDCGSGEETCQTAFAAGGTCFLDLGFSRWGWTNGPWEAGTYNLDIYAGAAQCDESKGTLVGTLTVNYDGGAANVTFSMTTGFTMDETQLYVGNDILPMNNGAYTVAPGQYPYIHEGLGGVSSDSYQVTGLSGEIYVVAHAVVCGEY